MRKLALSTVFAALLTAAAVPAFAGAATYTSPESKAISFSGGTVKNYALTGSVYQATGSPPQLYVSLSKPHESVSLSSAKNVKLTLAKNLSSGSVSADLGKQYGKIAMTFKSSAKATTVPAGKNCTGGSGTSRKGNLTGTFTTKWNDTYFKTVTKSKLAATASKNPKRTCPLPGGGGGGGSKTIFLSGSPKGLFVSMAKAPNGAVTETVGTSNLGAGPAISRTINVTAPASAFTVAPNASTAQVTGVGQSLGGKLKYAATSYYTGGSSGKLSGDFWVEFVGKGKVHPFAQGGIDGYLQKPGFVPPNQHPTADFTTSQDPGVLDVSFDGFSSSDPDGSIASYSWDFGDGSEVAHGATPSHTYATAGTKSVTLQVTDNKGATGSVTKNVIVAANQAPTAEFSWFQDDSSTDVFFTNESLDSDGEVTEYTWDFGDGSGVSHESDPVHSYPDPPTGSPYTVTLTVKDNGGETDPVSHSVSVTPAGP